jgi:hypothetical protein
MHKISSLAGDAKKKFDTFKNVMLDYEASLITASKRETKSFAGFVKNLQPISVGV